MNHDIDDLPHFDDPVHEREWLTQENAMRREGLHLDPAGDDVRSRRYRLLARALRAPVVDALPADFAERVSALAAASAHPPAPVPALERMLTITLSCALLAAAVVVTVIYGANWLPTFTALLPAPPAGQWLLAFAGCVGLSWLLGAWPRRLRPVT